MTVTCAEMKAIEKRADENGVNYYQMMENAGTAAFNRIMETTDADTFAVYCGKGNNGGDGFVIARLLMNAGKDVTVVLVDGEPKTTDAITNYNLIKDKVKTAELADADVIVDAIYGTGFHGKFREAGRKAADFINTSKAKVYAIDIPSGLSGDMTEEDEMPDIPVKADETISFHDIKPVHICEKAKPYLGKVTTVSIGIEHVL